MSVSVRVENPGTEPAADPEARAIVEQIQRSVQPYGSTLALINRRLGDPCALHTPQPIPGGEAVYLECARGSVAWVYDPRLRSERTAAFRRSAAYWLALHEVRNG